MKYIKHLKTAANIVMLLVFLFGLYLAGSMIYWYVTIPKAA